MQFFGKQKTVMLGISKTSRKCLFELRWPVNELVLIKVSRQKDSKSKVTIKFDNSRAATSTAII